MAELRPCPFCGGEAELKSHYLVSSVGWGKSYMTYHVRCKVCENRTVAFNGLDDLSPKDKAIEAWNRRSDGK